MAIKSGLTQGHFIGLEQFHCAELLTDEAGSTATYGDIIHIPELISINIQPQNQDASLYADNQSVETVNYVREVQLTIELAQLPLEYRAFLLGHKMQDGVMVISKDDVAPYVGISFVTNKSNGSKRYVRFAKVKFSEPDDNPRTKGENIEFNTPSISAKAIYRNSDGICYRFADEESGYTDLDDMDESKWFKSME